MYVKDIVQAIFLGIEKKVVRKAYFLTDGKDVNKRQEYNVSDSPAFLFLLQNPDAIPFLLSELPVCNILVGHKMCIRDRHRNGTVYQVNGGCSFFCFLVDDSSFFYVMCHVGNVYTHFP